MEENEKINGTVFILSGGFLFVCVSFFVSFCFLFLFSFSYRLWTLPGENYMQLSKRIGRLSYFTFVFPLPIICLWKNFIVFFLFHFNE